MKYQIKLIESIQCKSTYYIHAFRVSFDHPDSGDEVVIYYIMKTILGPNEIYFDMDDLRNDRLMKIFPQNLGSICDHTEYDKSSKINELIKLVACYHTMSC